MRFLLSLVFFFFICAVQSFAQQQPVIENAKISTQFIDKVNAKSTALEQKINEKSQAALTQLQKQEEKLRKRLLKIDSIAANNVFADAGNKYRELEKKLQNTKLKKYIPHLDSLSTSLKFLNGNPQLLKNIKEGQEKLKDALSRMKGLEGQLQKAEEIQRFLRERKQYLKEQLSKFGFAKELKKINKQVYYYAQQIKEYKEILKDPKKIEQKTLELLSKTKLFREFMKKNSMLASLFRLPENPGDPVNLAGLQTRAQVNGLIQEQIARGGPNAREQIRQNIQAAQSQLNQLKDKLLKSGSSSSDAVMPEGFKPNNQKTKTFLQRLEYGIDIQSQKANNFFPVTSDLGFSIGYKLNDKSIVGVGASYKLGWGSGWNNIKLTSEGVGLRSFVDWKIKGSIWLSGGYEQNYRNAFRNFSQLQNMNDWQQSGLIGLSKTFSTKTKFLKKARIQLLWDFLSYQQTPRGQPVVFRIGFSKR
ncbi:MAG: hypothetical protein KDC56_00220 [Flavobacteriaceae bacterium]|nr:hypothetical protein [Flavobacteriaceae bacterium]